MRLRLNQNQYNHLIDTQQECLDKQLFRTKPRLRLRPLRVTNQAHYRASYRLLCGALAQRRTQPPLKARAFLRIAPTVAAFAPSALETLCRSAAATADPIRRLHLPCQEAFHLSKPAHTSPASVSCCCCCCHRGQRPPSGSGTFQWPSRPPNSDRRPPSR